MNKLFGVMAFLFVALFLAQSVAAIPDINAVDANAVRHARQGEDFNVYINVAEPVQVSSDYNYLVRMSYGPSYVDLNVSTGSWGLTNGLGLDANGVVATVSGCTTGDRRVIQLGALKTFNFQINLSKSLDLNSFVGKEVAIELWKLTQDTTSVQNAICSGSTPDANGTFIIGPAILVRTAKTQNNRSNIDTNITVMGFDFDPCPIGTNYATCDSNVSIKYKDANNTILDLNIWDVDQNAMLTYIKNKAGGARLPPSSKDTNDMVLSINRDLIGVSPSVTLRQYGGWWVIPDRNGNFDVNITLPYVTWKTISDTNALWAVTTHSIVGCNPKLIVAGNNCGVVASTFGAVPSIITTTDQNAGITDASGNWYSIADAMDQNRITNFESVSKFSATVKNGGTPFALVQFNSDVNLAKGPARDYSADMVTNRGKVKMDTDLAPEFNVDANVTLYNVKSTGAIPYIMKDGYPCPASVCKNLDGSALSESHTDDVTGVKTWNYNSSARDGNLSFRVTGFSEYGATNLIVEVISPNGGEKWRNFNGTGPDGNVTNQISFRFKDLNISDTNAAALMAGNPMTAEIYFTSNGNNQASTNLIIKDTNLFDNQTIKCGSLVDVNLAADWTNCTFDWNSNDMNKAIGRWKIDVNVMGPWFEELSLGQTAEDYSDSNMLINPPLIEITDANLNSAHYVVRKPVGAYDFNLTVDFNVFFPDFNGFNASFDQNFTFSDYNIQIWYSTTQYSRGSDTNSHMISNMDLNLVPTGAGRWSNANPNNNNDTTVVCTAGATLAYDYSCKAQFDTNRVWQNNAMYYIWAEIKNITNAVASAKYSASKLGLNVIDTNTLWASATSTYAISINDTNAPSMTIAPSGTAKTTAGSFEIVATANDPGSDMKYYYFSHDSGTTWARQSSNTYTYSLPQGSTLPTSPTFTVRSQDYADNNSSDATVTVTFEAATSGTTTTTTPSGGAGGGGPTTPTEPTTEVVTEKEKTGTPEPQAVETTLTDAGYSAEQIAAIAEIATQNEVTQTVTVEKTVPATGPTTYASTVAIAVTNTGTKKWKDVKVIVEVPKNVAQSASEISSSYAMTVLKADPIVEFTIPEIAAGQTAEVKYSVDKSITEAAIDAMPLGMVAEFTEVTDLCEGVSCDDSNPCTIDSCNSATGVCSHTNKADGTSCGTGKECKAGTCTEKAVTPPVTPPPAAVDYTLPIAAIVVVIIVAAAYFLFARRK